MESGREIDWSHVREAEDLYVEYPDVASIRQMLEAILFAAARQAQGRGRPRDATEFLRRASELWPESSVASMALIRAYLDAAAWRDAELAARRALSSYPASAEIYRLLGRALMMQDRNEEAADALRRSLALQEDGGVRNLLTYVERGLAHERGMARREASHFRLHYEGHVSADIGRTVLQALERRYTELARTLDCEPEGLVPVILCPQYDLRDVSGGSGRAVGTFSHFDGRIRVAAGGLSGGVTAELEETLGHELTHAFVASRTRGAAPREIDEGLAQYLSGRRLGYRLDPSRAVPRDGKMTVEDFYDSALSFVEFLVDRYRQASVNELLKVMGETGDVDQAFRKTYRQSYEETREEWLEQLR